ncbi:hypothetical protein [Anatilimnocola aggregata]|uniref:hypothetical protein n=1 Tax=Anatilimnocola aggregata TaxID=2528021 RepID=UPI00192E6E77|nr:hypothetical protein [Anatilimnocola aggregata]
MLKAVLRKGLNESNRVHFRLDYTASLGTMESIDDAIDKFRGYATQAPGEIVKFSKITEPSAL